MESPAGTAAAGSVYCSEPALISGLSLLQFWSGRDKSTAGIRYLKSNFIPENPLDIMRMFSSSPGL